MKLAGPPAMMAVLLLTNSPAPMMPPMEIIVKWRPFSERLSSYLGADGLAKFGWFIGHLLLNLVAYYPASTSTRGSPSFGTVGPPHSCRSRIQGSGYAGCGLSNSRASRCASHRAWLSWAGALQSPVLKMS